ncbi:MAG: macrolide transporter, partial [Pseudomonadota bacterium]
MTAKTRWMVLAGLIAVTALTAIGWQWLNGTGERGVSYRVETVKRGDIESVIVSTGVVQPRNRLEIKPPIA